MDIKFQCANCGQHVIIDAAATGLEVSCPTCGTNFTVPLVVCARGPLSNLDPDETLTPSGITRKLKMSARNWILECSDDIYKKIQGSLLEGLNKGETMQKLTKRVLMELPTVGKDRAFIIAQAETQAAYGESSFHSIKQSGFKTKRWETCNDELVREAHRKCKAQGAIPIDQSFDNGLMYPGDLGSSKIDECIGCRCFLAPGDEVESQ